MNYRRIISSISHRNRNVFVTAVVRTDLFVIHKNYAVHDSFCGVNGRKSKYETGERA